MAALHSELTAEKEKLLRLYRLVEGGEDEPDDLLKGRHSVPQAEPNYGEGCTWPDP